MSNHQPQTTDPQTTAGWYADPENPREARYWDGWKWAATGQMSAPDRTADGKGGRALIIAGVIFAILIPVVGFLLGIVLLLKSRVGPGLGVIMLSVVTFLVVFALALAGSI